MGDRGQQVCEVVALRCRVTPEKPSGWHRSPIRISFFHITTMTLDKDGAMVILLATHCSWLTSATTAWSRFTPFLPLDFLALMSHVCMLC
jgi:hypothetical protein